MSRRWRQAVVAATALVLASAGGGASTVAGIVVVRGADYPAFVEATDGLVAGLQELLPDSPVVLWRLGDVTPEGTAPRLEAIAQVVCTVGVRATEAVLRARPGVPVVVVLATPPDHPDSSAAPVTGVGSDVPAAVQLEALGRLLPRLRRLGLLYSSGTAHLVPDILRAARVAGVDVSAQAVRPTDDVVDAAVGMGDLDAFWMLPDPVVFSPRSRSDLFAYLRRNRVPVLAPTSRFLQGAGGADVAVAPDPHQVGRQAATLVVRSLQGGRPRVEAPRAVTLYAKRRRGLADVPGVRWVE